MRKILIFVAATLILAGSVSIYILKWRAKNDVKLRQLELIEEEKLPNIPPPKLIYGLVEDSFFIEKFKVARNQNLATILLSQNVDYPIINQLADNCCDVFDVKRIRAGNQYSMFYSRDSLRTPLWFVYEIDNTDFVVMQLSDSLKVRRDSKPVEIFRQTATGTINSSLWNTVSENKLNPLLAIELSEIYAWTVDFFGIEKGDYFTVIYDEMYVDSTSVGIAAIHAAEFSHKGRNYLAFRFPEDSTGWSYYDEEGNSLRKAFLKAPLKFSRISSRFSNSRLHPVLKIRRPHHGVDYAASAGTPVYAIGDGTVLHRGWDAKGGGNYIKIRHNSVYTSVYMHLQGFAKGVSKGGFVRQGQLIGYVGSSGLSTGPHLDFRMYRNGSPTDPLKVEAPPVEPIAEEKMTAYLEFIMPLKSELEKLDQQSSLLTAQGTQAPAESHAGSVHVQDYEFSLPGLKMFHQR